MPGFTLITCFAPLRVLYLKICRDLASFYFRAVLSAVKEYLVPLRGYVNWPAKCLAICIITLSDSELPEILSRLLLRWTVFQPL